MEDPEGPPFKSGAKLVKIELKRSRPFYISNTKMIMIKIMCW
jgi:hypothetical protein